MITNIEVDGFKSLEKINLEIKPITILIGLNSSGKSSVLQLLAILKQSLKNHILIGNGTLANFGAFNEIVSKRLQKKEIKILIGGIRTQNLDAPFSGNTEYGYSFTATAEGIKSHSVTIKSGKIVVDATAKIDSSNRIQPAVHFNNNKSEIIFNQEFNLGYPLSQHSVTGPDINYASLHRFLEVIAKDLMDFRLVPTMRGISCPTYPLESNASEDLVDSSNLYSQTRKFCSTVVYGSPRIERKINKWLNKITGVTIRGRAVPDKQGSIEAYRKYEINLVNEGFGTNQLVHMFAQIAKSPANSIIGIEEPEVHLHPKAQSELAKVLIEISKEDRKNLVLTTHSEHILYRILIEVAKGTLSLEDLAIYHFKLSKDGVTQVERLKPDEKGRLKGGIPDFLETDLDEFKDFLDIIKG